MQPGPLHTGLCPGVAGESYCLSRGTPDPIGVSLTATAEWKTAAGVSLLVLHIPLLRRGRDRAKGAITAGSGAVSPAPRRGPSVCVLPGLCVL